MVMTHLFLCKLFALMVEFDAEFKVECDTSGGHGISLTIRGKKCDIDDGYLIVNKDSVRDRISILEEEMEEE